MTTHQEEDLFEKSISLASELEAFEPRLNGFADHLGGLKAGKELSESVILRYDKMLQSENVAEIAYNLNMLAGQYFTTNELEKAKRLCQAAHLLYTVSLGKDHPDTMVVSDNLQKLNEKAKPSKLPKLKKFNKPKF